MEPSDLLRSVRRAVGLLAWLLIAVSAEAQVEGVQIMPNYRDAGMRQVIEAVGEVTGRNFLVDPRVTGQVTFLSYTPMSEEAFYEAFLATLAVHGFAAVEAGDAIKIVPDANARVHPGVASGTDGDRVVTRVVQLDNVGAAQLVPILRPLLPQYAHLAAHPGTNTLIIVDRGANVDRILQLVERIDMAVDNEIEVIHLENASAADAASLITAFSQANAAEGGAMPQLAADARTNSIMISGPANQRMRVRALVAHLDLPAREGGGSQVRYLHYADAEQLAANLQTQFAAESGQGEDVTLWADVGTNSLIIDAPARVLHDINAVIDRLDIRRAQVQVDAIIVEVTESRANELGMTWALQGDGGDGPVAGTNFPGTAPGILQLGAAAANANALAGAPEGLLTAVGRFGDGSANWAGVLTALAGDSATNIIATPTIVTLDNEEATIEVGSEVPFLSGQYTGTNNSATGALNPFQTITRSPVGTRLMITPRINEGSGIRLQIEQETSSISQGTQGAVDLITDRRSIATTVFVDDGSILVLGGLIDDQLREVEQRVPVLGRIPVVGALFRSQSTELDKTNLMVFIRPTILRDSIEATFQTDARYRYIRDLQLGLGTRNVQLMRDAERPVLPDIEEVPGGPAPTAADEDPTDPALTETDPTNAPTSPFPKTDLDQPMAGSSTTHRQAAD